MTWKVKKSIEYAGYVIGMALLFHIMYQTALLNIDAHHDGTVFNPSLVVSRGGVLFRDTSTYYGPLLIYIQALFIKLFGESLSAVKLSAVIFYVLSYFVYFNIFKRFIPKILVIASEIALFLVAPYWMVVFHAWSSVYALFFILCMMYLCVRFIECENHFSALLCGVCASLLLMIRTPVGVVFIFAGGVVWAVCHYLTETGKQKIRPMIQYGVGIIAGFFPFLITFCVQGTLKAWWNDCVLWAVNFALPKGEVEKDAAAVIQPALPVITDALEDAAAAAAGGQSGWHKFWDYFLSMLGDLFPVRDSGIFIVLPVISLFVFFYLLYLLWIERKEAEGKNKKKQIILLCLVWFSLASWHQYFPVSERRHWYWAGFPMMGILVYSIYFCLKGMNQKWRIMATILFLFTLSANTIAERYEYYQVKRETYIYEMPEEATPYMKGIKLSKEQLEFFESYCMIVNELNENFPQLAIQNDTNLDFLNSLNNNDRIEIDAGRAPFIISFRSDEEGKHYPGYFNAIKLEYSEEDFIENTYDVSIFYPFDFSQ